MIRATELDGRAVIDMDAAEKLGRIEKVILDPGARRVAGFVVGRGGSMFGQGSSTTTVPAAAVHAIGPDAVTVRQSPSASPPPLDGLPRASDVIGRKVVSTDGRFLGFIEDVLISGETGRIFGYQLGDADALSKLGKVFGDRKADHMPVLRADADIRAGRDLIVAPEDAIAEWTGEPVPPAAAAPPPKQDGDAQRASWYRGAAAEPEPGLEDPLR